MRIAYICAVLAAIVATLVTLPWEDQLQYEFVAGGTAPDAAPLDTAAYTRSTVHFTSMGTRCEGWFYLPKGTSERPPVVIMGHGLGAQKDMSLHSYATAFASSGMAVFAFDYRTFGGSDGQPRNWASPYRHLQDWTASYNYVKETGIGGKVDSSRVALWGTSFAGGHVLVLASRLGNNVSAVVSQMPHLSGMFATKHRLSTKGLLPVLRLLAIGAHDKLRSLAGLPGAYMQLVGGEGDLALMQCSSHELETYFSRHPKQRQGGWRPMVLARVLLELSRYNPLDAVPLVKAPVLLVAATQDALCPSFLVQDAAAKLGDKATLLQRNTTHFGIYRAGHQPEVAAEMTAFLALHLGVRGVKKATGVAAAAAADLKSSGVGGVAAGASKGSSPAVVGGDVVAGDEGGSGDAGDLRS